MGIKQLYNDNLRKLPNEYGDVSVMFNHQLSSPTHFRRPCKSSTKVPKQSEKSTTCFPYQYKWMTARVVGITTHEYFAITTIMTIFTNMLRRNNKQHIPVKTVQRSLSNQEKVQHGSCGKTITCFPYQSLTSLQLVLCRVAAVKRLPVHQP